MEIRDGQTLVPNKNGSAYRFGLFSHAQKIPLLRNTFSIRTCFPLILIECVQIYRNYEWIESRLNWQLPTFIHGYFKRLGLVGFISLRMNGKLKGRYRHGNWNVLGGVTQNIMFNITIHSKDFWSFAGGVETLASAFHATHAISIRFLFRSYR